MSGLALAGYLPKFAPDEFRCFGLHYRVSIAGTRFVFAAIPKNGSSLMMRLVNRRLHPAGVLRSVVLGKWGSDGWQRRNRAYYRVGGPYMTTHPGEPRLFVYRPPLERLISAYINKFVDSKGARSIQASFERITGVPACQASFRDFVDYIRTDFSQLDQHVWPQKAFLLDVEYTPVPLYRLREHMVQLIGAGPAGRYFSERINPSDEADLASKSRIPAQDLADAPADELSRMKCGGHPLRKDDFLQDGQIREYLRHRYRYDIQMVEQLDRQFSAGS